MRTRSVVAAVLVTAWAQAADAQPGAPAEVPAGLQRLSWRAESGQTLDLYLARLRGDFFELDADADGRITLLDADLHTRMESIQLRNHVMHFDLNGDGVVTEDEVRRGTKYDMRMSLALVASNLPDRQAVVETKTLQQIVDKIVQSIMALDADGDGKVSYAEAGALDRYDMPRQFSSSGQSGIVGRVLTLDADAGGSVALDEFQAAGEALFRKINADGNGVLSQQEVNEYGKRPEMPDAAARQAALGVVRARAEQARAACNMPAPSPKAKVIMLGAYGTQALSSVAIGPQDAVVDAGRIVVEPGDEPLYVVATTNSAVVWQFSGAVDRVERLAMTSVATDAGLGTNNAKSRQPPLVAATGLPRDKIVFLAKSNCLGAFAGDAAGQSERVAAVRDATGREPDGVFWGIYVRGFSIPSGQVESLSTRKKTGSPKNGAEALRIEGDISKILGPVGPSRALTMLYSSAPGGLVDIDPKSVIANLPVQTYETFPREAGLVQLMESGALRQNNTGDYVVQGKMRFPPGLHGGHLVKFVVPRGTAVPEGDPGHSCVLVEDPASERKFPPCR